MCGSCTPVSYVFQAGGSAAVFLELKTSACRWGFPRGSSGKEPACQCKRHKIGGFDPWVRRIPWRRAWQPSPVFLPGESHGQRSLAVYSPWDRKEPDMHAHSLLMRPERLSTSYSKYKEFQGRGARRQTKPLFRPLLMGAS